VEQSANVMHMIQKLHPIVPTFIKTHNGNLPTSGLAKLSRKRGNTLDNSGIDNY